ncbi:MAG: hypothetical protein B7733_16485 [Myxococcales bacterium FL481]|nr:MAG: hypothetical protein B7733_16485 [Myxococcales bacterium FL481]
MNIDILRRLRRLAFQLTAPTRAARRSLWLVPLGLALGLTPSSASARDAGFGTAWPSDVEDPEAWVPSTSEANAKPLAFGYYLMELARLGEEAEDRKDWPRAAQFYRALSVAVPHRATGPRLLCRVHLAANETASAREACRETLARDGAKVGDFKKWIKLEAKAGKLLTEDEIADATGVIDHMRSQPDGRLASFEAECELGVHLDSNAMLSNCVPQLLQMAPDTVSTVAYAWHQAVATGDTATARKLVERARELGVNKKAIQRMASVTDQAAQRQSGCSGCATATSGGHPPWHAAVAVLGVLVTAAATRRRRDPL